MPVASQQGLQTYSIAVQKKDGHSAAYAPMAEGMGFLAITKLASVPNKAKLYQESLSAVCHHL